MANRVIVDAALPRPLAGTIAHPRLEINTFIADIRQFSLYVQALQILYDRDTNDVVSHWQIGGIHGEPHVDWNGTASPNNGRGYCMHRRDVFPTWHRPYVVLFEQEVQRIARELAATYTHEPLLWVAAAAALRQPYWGWDHPDTVVPPAQVISDATVQIRRPNSPTLVAVPNPFLSFTYPPDANADFNPPFNVRPRTVRYPDEDGNSDTNLLTAVLQEEAHQIVNNFERLFSLTTWNAFARGSASTTGLEGIHDTIHLRAGGGGTGGSGNMSVISVAAFDPIFFLHHAQVDRVIDLWHRTHPTQWTTNTDNLLPFRNTQATYWKSPDIINNNDVFNYSYPNIVNAPESASSEPAPANDSTAAQINNNLEWSIRVQCKEYEVGGSFSVFLFLANEVPPDHQEWFFHPTFAGTFDVFANSNPDQCANCVSHMDDLLNGFVHINRKFLERSKQVSLDPEVVVPYLKNHISWAVQKADGEVVDLHKFPSLEVTIICTPLELPEGAKYPSEGMPKVYPEITRGRVGGERAT